MTDILARFLPPSLCNTETQALILAGLCFIGSWVLITKMIQFIFSMIWPFLVLGAFLMLAPQWTSSIVSEIMPVYVKIFQEYFRKIIHYIKEKNMKKECNWGMKKET